MEITFKFFRNNSKQLTSLLNEFNLSCWEQRNGRYVPHFKKYLADIIVPGDIERFSKLLSDERFKDLVIETGY
jgi:hypothetical protein